MSNLAKVLSVISGLVLSAILIAGVTGFLLLLGIPMLFAAGTFAGAQGLVTLAVVGSAVKNWKVLGND